MFEFLKRRRSVIAGGILNGATDNHSHILYDVDDGVRTVEESLATLSYLEEQGLDTLWLTPHIMEDVPNTTEGLKQRFEDLRGVYKGGIKLFLAAEYMIDNLFEKRLADRDLLLHGGDRVLVETSTWAPPIDLWGTLERIMKAGYRPIVAHPERYRYMRPSDYKRLHDMGCLLQLNLSSIIGAYGELPQAKAVDLLNKGWYCMFGSDCHRFRAIRQQYEHKVFLKDTVKQLSLIAKGVND